MNKYEEIGRRIIGNPSEVYPPLPLKQWQEFALYFTIEFEVVDYEAEVGFWSGIFGVRFLSIDPDYAILTDEPRTFTFSLIRAASGSEPAGVKVQWFTDELDVVLESLRSRGIDYEIHHPSANQRFARFLSPNRLVVEVWSGWEEVKSTTEMPLPSPPHLSCGKIGKEYTRQLASQPVSFRALIGTSPVV